MEIKKWNIIDQPRPVIISGPCSAESEEQVVETAQQLAGLGKVDILRAGIWKPRTRPGSFEGVGVEALKWIKSAGKETGLPVSVEVANAKHVYEALKHQIDIVWIGARTSVNPFSVQEIADALEGVDIPVLIKNPVNPDIELWVGAIERVLKAGITRVGAIHRGFTRFAPGKYRNEPQWQIPIELKRRYPELNIICDPSHICGKRDCIQQVSQRALDLDFQGLMIESHIDPANALSDKDQQVTPEQLDTILDSLVIRRMNGANDLLGDLRTRIDQIDDELLQLFSKRMEVAEEIGNYKKQNNITILQTGRWNEIIEKTMLKAGKLGLSKPFIERMLKAIHQESINHQNSVMNR